MRIAHLSVIAIALLLNLSLPPAFPGDTPPAPPVTNGVTIAPLVTKQNSNSILTAYAAKLALSASTSWAGYPIEKLVDGNLETSWFSAAHDLATKDNKPWIEIKFPEETTITHITLLGNRDPAWPKNFSILSARIELFDKDCKVLKSAEVESAQAPYDFDFVLKGSLKNVQSIRITVLGDQGATNGFDDIALAEIQVE